MSVDKFGRYAIKHRARQQQRGPPGYGFKFTPEGNFDVENKKIQNLAESDSDFDAATVHYVNNKCKDLESKLAKSPSEKIKLIKEYFVNKYNINKLHSLLNNFQILQTTVELNKKEISELQDKVNEYAANMPLMHESLLKQVDKRIEIIETKVKDVYVVQNE